MAKHLYGGHFPTLRKGEYQKGLLDIAHVAVGRRAGQVVLHLSRLYTTASNGE